MVQQDRGDDRAACIQGLAGQGAQVCHLLDLVLEDPRKSCAFIGDYRCSSHKHKTDLSCCLSYSIVLKGKETIEAIDQDALDKIESAQSGVKVLTGVTVDDLNVSEQTVTLNSGKVLKYGKVLLATGGVPKTLPVLQGAGADKVTTFRSVEDFKKLHSLVKASNKKIVIVGGGFLGSELAVAISHYGKIIFCGIELWRNWIDFSRADFCGSLFFFTGNQ